MLFWIVAAVITVLVVLVLARPLAARISTEPASAPAVRIYKDQLSEIVNDETRGLISPEEAGAARIEVSRRLLAAAGEQDAAPHHVASTIPAHLLIRGLALALPLSAIGLYLAVGAPTLPDQPFASRPVASRPENAVADLIARVEQRLRDHPEEGQGWEVIAPIYLRQERYQEAAVAFGRAIELLGETPKRLVGLGEALVYQNGGVVPEDARRAFERASELAPDQQEPRFWQAVADEQDGRFAAAAEKYRVMLAHAPANAPWVDAVRERLGSLEKRLSSAGRSSPLTAPAPSAAGRQSPQSPQRGPTAGDVAAAQQMAPADRLKMIEGMVGALADRLAKDGADPEGWERLVRSYVVLGRNDEAIKALGAGRKALAKDPAGLARIEALAKSLGVEG